MSERHKPHNGRDVSGNHHVRRVDVDDLVTDPNGVDYLRDDVRTGGAVADVSAAGAEQARHIGDLVQENAENVRKLAERDRS